MLEIKAIVRIDRLEAVVHAIRRIPGASGSTVSKVEGFGRVHPHHPESEEFGRVLMAKVETVVDRSIAPAVLEAISTAAATGRPGDGKIFVLPVEQVVNIRAGGSAPSV